MGVVKTLKRRLSSSSSKSSKTSSCGECCYCGLNSDVGGKENAHKLQQRLHMLCSYNISTVDWSVDIQKLSQRLIEAIETGDQEDLKDTASSISLLKKDMRRINLKTAKNFRKKQRNPKKYWKSLNDQEYQNELTHEEKLASSLV